MARSLARAEINTTPTSMKPSNQMLARSLVLCASATSMLVSVVSAQAATYSSTILGDSPVAYYRLEELSGATTATDSSGSAFDAIYSYDLDTNGVPDYPLLGLPGIETNSALFLRYVDAASVVHRGFVSIPFHPELSPVSGDGQHGAPFSVECWVKALGQPADYSIPLAMFGRYESGIYNNASGWNFYQSPGPNSFWIFNVKNGTFAQAAGVPIQPLQWYHLAGTFDGATIVFYVNGIARVTSGGVTTYLADHNFDGQIGAGDNTGFLAFNGSVDEVAFYTNVLSAAQILNHYQVGTNSFSGRAFPPMVLQDPASITVSSGSTAKFTVVADGATPLSYQWLRNGNAISGATTNPLSFTANFNTDNGATFSVILSNSFGSMTSAVATLTVVGTLSIDHSPFSITRQDGSNSMAAFRVAASGATPISIQWYKVSGGTTNIIAGATSDTLWLSNLQLSDSGNAYFAHVTNAFVVTNSDQATLTVTPRQVNVPITGYARIVVADHPTAYWRLDEGPGSTAVDAVGSFNGTYAGGSDLTFNWPAGIPHETDPAVHLTNSANVTVPYALELNPVTGPWSAEFWLQPTSQDPVEFHTPISSIWNSDFGNHIFGWNLYQHPQSYWTYNPFNGGAGGGFISDLADHPLVTNSWYHFVITDDLTNQRMYVNNKLQVNVLRGPLFIANGINGDPAVAGGPTTFGVRSDGIFGAWDGGIDEVAFYNYALSAQQIENHFSNNVRLRINKVGNQVVLTWPVGTLQASPNVTGIYTNVTGASSPYTNAVSGSATFYRLQVQ
jgi:hypothetical protein